MSFSSSSKSGEILTPQVNSPILHSPTISDDQFDYLLHTSQGTKRKRAPYCNYNVEEEYDFEHGRPVSHEPIEESPELDLACSQNGDQNIDGSDLPQGQEQHTNRENSMEETDVDVLSDFDEFELQDDTGDLIRSSIFGRKHSLEQECQRLQDVLKILARSACSRQDCQDMISTKSVKSNYSYTQLKRYILNRSGLIKSWVKCCPDGHMALTGLFQDLSICNYEQCKKKINSNNKFFYCKASVQIQAMLLEKDSFHQLMEGCKRARKAADDSGTEIMFDYYDGKLFQEGYGQKMRNWNQDEEVHIFFSFSTDGFDVFKNGFTARSSWPVILNVLNLHFNFRYKASNELIIAFIPGSHISDYFETFLSPLLDDLSEVKNGIFMHCWDGRRRKVFGHVLFVTADWPAGTKVAGYMGHNAKKPCRYCEKSSNDQVMKPFGDDHSRLRAISTTANYLRWFQSECGQKRTIVSIRQAWNRLGIPNQSRSSTQNIRKETGIKRRPLISSILINFCDGIPYDPMHLLLQGLVKTTMELMFGIHAKTNICCTYVLPERNLDHINSVLSSCASGYPASWGRFPPPLSNISAYKAESFKSFTLHFSVPILFGIYTPTQRRSNINRYKIVLWVTLRDILLISFNPTPKRSDIADLKLKIQRFHALYTTLFAIDNNHQHCFTPTSHAIFHLPQILDSCGPLLNVSQFLAERVIGEVSRYVKTPRNLETNLLNESIYRFALRMTQGGLQKLSNSTNGSENLDNFTNNFFIDEEEYNLHNHYGDTTEESNNCNQNSNLVETHISNEATSEKLEWTLTGRKRSIIIDSLSRELKRTIELLVDNNVQVNIKSIFNYQSARRQSSNENDSSMILHVESDSTFKVRQDYYCHHGYQVRQKCWIASKFESEPSETYGIEPPTETYYGVIKNFYEVEIEGEGIQLTDNTYLLAEIEWMYGLTFEKDFGIIYTNNNRGSTRGTIRDSLRTYERVSVIDRLIGYFDYQGRRFFLDNNIGEVFSGETLLRGIRSRS